MSAVGWVVVIFCGSFLIASWVGSRLRDRAEQQFRREMHAGAAMRGDTLHVIHGDGEDAA